MRIKKEKKTVAAIVWLLIISIVSFGIIQNILLFTDVLLLASGKITINLNKNENLLILSQASV